MYQEIKPYLTGENFMDRIKGNKLILQYLNIPYSKYGEITLPDYMYHLYVPFNIFEIENGIYEYKIHITDLKFHTSYDWLKIILNKIQSDNPFKTIDECTDKEWFYLSTINRATLSDSTENIYKTIVSYLKFYFSNK